MLAGFHAMDEHFRSAPFEQQPARADGAARRSGTTTSSTRRRVAVLPYDQYLKRFPGLPAATDDGEQRQARHARRRARRLSDRRRSIWGEPGTNGQHSFYQLIHQGTRLVPCDFIGFCQPLNPLGQHHDLLMANLFAQTEALAFGKTEEEVKAEGTPGLAGAAPRLRRQSPDQHAAGRAADAAIAGSAGRALRAQRVHAGVIWNIDSFDQWGVELGKVAGAAHHPRARERARAAARARQFDQRADPALPPAAPARIMPVAIEDYAMIGDMRTAALVGRDGSIDWFCAPRFDSGACFSALLGERDNGRWKIAPRRAAQVRRHYRGSSLVLETRFETQDGVVAIVDFMPVDEAQPSIVRLVIGREGSVAMEMRTGHPLRLRRVGAVGDAPGQANAHGGRRSFHAGAAHAGGHARRGHAHRRPVHGEEGPDHPLRPELCAFAPDAAGAGRCRAQLQAHRSLLARLGVALQRQGQMVRACAPLAGHAQGLELPPDRRHRCRADHLAAGKPGRACATGTIASAGCAMRRSRCWPC